MSAEQTGRPTEQEWAEALCREYHPMHWDVSYGNRSKACQACQIHAAALRPLIAREREAARAEGAAAEGDWAGWLRARAAGGDS